MHFVLYAVLRANEDGGNNGNISIVSFEECNDINLENIAGRQRNRQVVVRHRPYLWRRVYRTQKVAISLKWKIPSWAGGGGYICGLMCTLRENKRERHIVDRQGSGM